MPPSSTSVRTVVSIGAVPSCLRDPAAGKETEAPAGRLACLALFVLAAALFLPSPASAQVGQKVPPGPLSRAHAFLEGGDNCQTCHGPDQKVSSESCLSCHQPIADRIRLKRGVHREAAGACSSCHVEHGGVDADLRLLDPAGFDHAAEAGFPLQGRHAAVSKNCSACHTTRSFLALSPSCSSCHKDPHGGANGAACASCHTPERWADASRAFHKTGRFSLDGRHLGVPCAQCHVRGAIEGTPTTCYGCHWVRRQDDPYRTRLGADCEACHRPTSWTAVTWNHGAATGVALSVAHRSLGCDSCHVNRRFDAGSPSCYACHAKQYQSAREPPHQAAGFPTQCELCHKPSHASFGQATFQHVAYFPLTGVHATQACSACHKNNVYRGTPRDCFGCHRTDYERTTSPNHAAAGFPTTCESCHRASDATWKTTFNHASVFALVGAHATQSCTACHQNNIYRGTPRDCFGCHRTDYERTTRPNHAAAGFPTACESCHSASSPTWSAAFDHNRFFVLAGRHLTAPCSSCHVNNIYRGTPRECYPCHQAQYEQARDPNHRAAGFPTACELCHRSSDLSFDQGRFTHTWFPITSGPHAGRTCADCHPNPTNFKVFSCTTCHGRAETDKDHEGVAGYRYDSAACYSCHPTGRA